MSTTSIKEEARRFIDHLPEDSTWEDLQYQIYVRQAIEAGLKDSEEGKTIPIEEVRRRFGVGKFVQESWPQGACLDFG